jgi:septum formation protein
MTLWRADHPLILASQSAARQALLRNAGIVFEAIPADVDERAIQRRSGVTAPQEIAALLAREKAFEVARRRPGRLVIGADQTLALGERLFNKPAGRDDAARQLRALAGQTHALFSAVAAACDSELLFADVAVARLTMRALSDGDISAYLDAAGAAVTTTVGAYQLEGLGIHLFERIEGDHFTILGLPLLPLLGYLRRRGLLAL